jgi:hypothetical protein
MHWCIKSWASLLNEDFFLTIRLAGEEVLVNTSDATPFNTRENMDVIVSSVITKIFNPMQVLNGHISTFLNDTRVFIQYSYHSLNIQF